MSSRLDSVLKKHPEHEPWIRLFASRDPSGNLKYLDWSMKVLISGQALAPEIADVVDLFHLYNGRSTGSRREHIHIRSDIHSYLPHQLANLRDDLIKVNASMITESENPIVPRAEYPALHAILHRYGIQKDTTVAEQNEAIRELRRLLLTAKAQALRDAANTCELLGGGECADELRACAYILDGKK